MQTFKKIKRKIKKVIGKMLIIAIAVVIVFTAVVLNPNSPRTSAAGEGWYSTDGNWQYRKTVTIDHLQVGSDLTNFPVLINVTNNDFKDSTNLGHVGQSDGGDFVFTKSDGTTKLDHEIEKYDNTTGELVAWVEVDTLSSVSDTVLYIYYGDATCLDQWNTNGTWNSDYKMVQHLKDTTTSSVTDSTTNANNGTKKGANEPIEAVGQIGKSQSFDGTDDYINFGDSATLNNAQMTVSGWINADSTGETIGGVESYTKISDFLPGNESLDSSDYFGVSVGIGDLDSDGIEDLAAGAYMDDDGGVDVGAIWITFMNTDGTVKSYTKINDASLGNLLDAGDQFGNSVTNIGDLDNDGIQDLAVGAFYDDDGGTNTGAVWVMFMNTNGTVKSYAKINDTSMGGLLDASDFFGVSVAGIGDLDSDGIEDLAISAHGDDDGATDAGAIWVIYMNTNGSVKSYAKINNTSLGGGLEASDYFGSSVASIGDLDNDGIQDLAGGAFYDDDGAATAGAVWIMFMNTNGSVKSYAKINDTSLGDSLDSGDSFGKSVTGLGDLDGDSIEDLAGGAFYDDDGGTNNGAIYIMYMNADGSVKSYAKINDTSLGGLIDSGDWLGSTVSNIGDLDDDGINDIISGALYDDDGGTDTGAVWVIYMNANGTVKSYAKINDTSLDGGIDTYNLFGRTVANIDDLDGDGVQDIAVGDLYNDYGAQDAGAIRIMFMNTNGSIKSSSIINSASVGGNLEALDYFGTSIANIGDLDNDGIQDIAVGANYDDDGGTNAGAVWVLFMNTNGTVKSYAKINDTSLGGGLDSSDIFGVSVAGIGDLDNDGIEDLAAGALWDDDGASAAGAVWIMFMNTNGTVKSYAKINDTSLGGGLDGSDDFGYSVTNIGDLDDDGVQDLAAGAAYDDDGAADAGALWIMFMNTNGTVKSYAKINDANLGDGLDAVDYFGVSVTNIGDLNNDGIQDLAAGAYFDDDGGTNAGAVWIIYMNSNGTVKSYAKINDTSIAGYLDTLDYFGIGASGIGDLDGDSIEDITITAYGDDDGGNGAGAVWTIFLNSDGTVKTFTKINDAVLDGSFDASDYFGSSIDNIGDLDGDGIEDLAVGAYTDDDGGADVGAVYIMFMNTDYTVKSYRKINDTDLGGLLDAGDGFGMAVTNINDLDNDGVQDLAVGAYTDDDGGTDQGAVWILFMNTDGSVKSYSKINDTSLGGLLDASDIFGCSVAGIGDLDDDGIPDIASTQPNKFNIA